jgi:hypothetical protein
MGTILSGSSHTALRFMREHWADLIQVSLLPFLGVATMLIVQLIMFRDMFSDLFPLIDDGKFEGQAFQTIMNMQAGSFFLTLATALFSAWQFVRITRLYLLGEKPWIGLEKPEVAATLMTMLYLIGIYLLTLVVYIAALVVLAIPVIILAIAMGSGDSPSTSVAVLIAVLIPLFLAFMIWFACRFAVGLPAVALGKTPDFFKEMWGLSKGASWGFALRIILASLVAVLIMALAMAISALIFIRDIWVELFTQPEPPIPPAQILRDLFDRLLPSQVIWALVQQPFIWFFVLLTVEAYRRFTDARSRSLTAAAPRTRSL